MHSKQVGLTKCDGLEYWIYPNLTGPEVRGFEKGLTHGGTFARLRKVVRQSAPFSTPKKLEPVGQGKVMAKSHSMQNVMTLASEKGKTKNTGDSRVIPHLSTNPSCRDYLASSEWVCEYVSEVWSFVESSR